MNSESISYAFGVRFISDDYYHLVFNPYFEHFPMFGTNDGAILLYCIGAKNVVTTTPFGIIVVCHNKHLLLSEIPFYLNVLLNNT